MYTVTTLSGAGKAHYSTNGVKTLCGRDGGGITSKTDICARCAKKRAELDDHAARVAYYAGVAETQDEVMSQAQPVKPEVEAQDAATEDEMRDESGITEGSTVETTKDVTINHISRLGGKVYIPAGTRCTVVEVCTVYRWFEYLVSIPGRDQEEWLTAREIRLVDDEQADQR